MSRRDSCISWLNVNRDRIQFARKGYLNSLLADYNHDHPEAALKDKPELWRWLYFYRRHHNVPIHYCPSKGKRIRSRPKNSNYQEA